MHDNQLCQVCANPSHPLKAAFPSTQQGSLLSNKLSLLLRSHTPAADLGLFICLSHSSSVFPLEL